MKLTENDVEIAKIFFEEALNCKIEDVSEIKMKDGANQYILYAGLNSNSVCKKIILLGENAFLLDFEISPEREKMIVQCYEETIVLKKSKEKSLKNSL